MVVVDQLRSDHHRIHRIPNQRISMHGERRSEKEGGPYDHARVRNRTSCILLCCARPAGRSGSGHACRR